MQSPGDASIFINPDDALNEGTTWTTRRFGTYQAEYIPVDRHNALIAAERERAERLDDCLRQKDQAMTELFRLLERNDVDYSHLIS